MKSPKFWNSKKNILSWFFYPMSLLYYFGYKARIFFNIKPYKSKIPIICVGNVNAGGAGKTPVAIEIGKILKKKRVKFAYLTKGYKGKFRGCLKVSKNHSVEVVGDEALLLHEISDTFVAKNRLDGIREINKRGKYKYIITDDGFQNPTFFKNKNILVIDGEYGFGNGFLLPAGPLREKLSDGLKKADLVIVIGKDRYLLQETIRNEGVKVTKGKIKVTSGKKFKKHEYIAFSGIGRPEKFYKSLDETGIKTCLTKSFADHYFFKDRDIKGMFKLIKKHDCRLITTKKDWVRIEKKYRSKVDYLDVEIQFDKPKIIEKFLLKK